jgi:hypothetical protein
MRGEMVFVAQGGIAGTSTNSKSALLGIPERRTTRWLAAGGAARAIIRGGVGRRKDSGVARTEAGEVSQEDVGLK